MLKVQCPVVYAQTVYISYLSFFWVGLMGSVAELFCVAQIYSHFEIEYIPMYVSSTELKQLIPAILPEIKLLRKYTVVAKRNEPSSL